MNYGPKCTNFYPQRLNQYNILNIVRMWFVTFLVNLPLVGCELLIKLPRKSFLDHIKKYFDFFKLHFYKP
jgi:hypothetical protein